MELLEQIREMLARLAQLTKEELDDLRSKIVECADTYDAEATTPENVAILNELAEAGENVMSRQAEIEAAEAQAEIDKQAARDRLAKISGNAGEEPEDGGGDAAGEGDAAAGGEGGGATAETPTAVAASGKPSVPSATRMSRSTSTTPSSPEMGDAASRSNLVAAAGLPGTPPGTVFEDKWQLAQAISLQLQRMRKTDRSNGGVLVASAEYHYPDERRISDDFGDAMRKMDAVTSREALVATGGICAPVNVDWTLPTFAGADRPIRDGLPAFEATRGGITFRTPPSLSGLANATGVWTEATDLNPAGATKPVLTISCPSTQTVYVSAVSTRLGFGNMESMFDPETVAANTDLAIAAAARIAENNLLTQLHNVSVQGITTAKLLGAARDFLGWLDAIGANYRTTNRIPRSTMLTIILPDWVKDLIRADRVRELAHDATSSLDPLAVSDDYIESLFTERHYHPIFHLDGLATEDSEPQQFTAPTASSAMPSFPSYVVSTIFVEGSVQFLDGGRLDLGVVRDSTLDATNDYETFVETFENLAFRGFANGAWEIVSNLCANGGSAATVATTSFC